jgi:SH3-like domain-containing protein
MKRTLFLGLFLAALLSLSLLWLDLAGARAAAPGLAAAQPALLTRVPFAPAIGPAQVATISARERADAYVSYDGVNLRTGPGLEFSSQGKYKIWTLLTVLGQARDSDNKPWLYVRTPDGKKGWMSARPSFQTTRYLVVNRALSTIPFVQPPTPISADGYVNINNLNMRTGPGLGYRSTGKYAQGTPLDILGQKPDSQGMPWLYVRTPDGKEGYVSARPSLTRTPYVQINISHSQIPRLSDSTATIKVEELVLDAPVYTNATPSGPKFWLYRLRTTSCDDACAPIIYSTQTVFSGSEVCMEWYEIGTPDSGEDITIDFFRNGVPLGNASILAEGDKICNPLKLTLPQPGEYKAIVKTNIGAYNPVEWTVD